MLKKLAALRVFSVAWLKFARREEEKKMLKKFGYSLVIVGALMFGVGVVNTGLIGTAMATEEKKCDKCGHMPSKGEKDCKCECHSAKH